MKVRRPALGLVIATAVLLWAAAVTVIVCVAIFASKPKSLTIDLQAAELKLSGPSKKNPDQALSLSSDVLAHARSVRIGQKLLWQAPSSTSRAIGGQLKTLSLLPPKDLGCRALSLAVAEAEKATVLTVQPLLAKVGCAGDAKKTWALYLGASRRISEELEPDDVLEIELQIPSGSAPVVLENVLASELLAIVEAHPDVNGTKTSMGAPGSPLHLKGESLAYTRIELRATDEPGRKMVLVGHLKVLAPELFSLTGSDQLASNGELGWTWVYRLFAILVGPLLALLQLAIAIRKEHRDSKPQEARDSTLASTQAILTSTASAANAPANSSPASAAAAPSVLESQRTQDVRSLHGPKPPVE
jgi:hypothetical protein